MPWPVFNGIQVEVLYTFHWGQMVSHVDFVGKEECWQIGRVLVLQHGLELLLDHAHAQFVAAVDHENDGLRVLVIMLPQISILACARHIKYCEVDRRPGELFHVKPDCWCHFRQRDLLGLEVLDDGGLAAVVQADA